MREIETEDGIARVQASQHHRRVRRRSGVGLDIGPTSSEKLLQAINRQLLHLINNRTTAVVALAWQPFGVLVRQDTSLRQHDIVTHVVLGSNEFNAFDLAAGLALNQRSDLGITHVAKLPLENGMASPGLRKSEAFLHLATEFVKPIQEK